MVKNMDIHNHIMRKKLNLHVINMGICLHNKVPDQLKLRGSFNLFKKDLKSFLLNHTFYSVEESMSF
jgi:hypothetical protein